MADDQRALIAEALRRGLITREEAREKLNIAKKQSGQVDTDGFTPPTEQPAVSPQPVQIQQAPLDDRGFFEQATDFLTDTTLSNQFLDFVTGRDRETVATRELPEIGSVETGGTIGQNIKVAAGLLTTLNPKAQQDIILENFPGTRFQEDEKGNVIVNFPQEDGSFKSAILNKPGASFQDATQLTAQALAFLPTARLAGLGRGLLAKIGIGGAGASATDVALQASSQALGSEQPFDPTQAAIAGGLGVGAELAGGGIQALTNLRRARAFDLQQQAFGEALPSVQVAEEATEQLSRLSPTGQRVQLTKGQQTLDPTQLAATREIATTPEGSRIALKTFGKQNEQVARAVDDVIDTISDAKAIERGEVGFRTAADDAIEEAVNVRRLATEPLYDDAIRVFDEGAGLVPLKGVKNTVLSIRKGAAKGSTSQKTMNKVLELLKGEKIPGTPAVKASKIIDPSTGQPVTPARPAGPETTSTPTMRQLHDAKLEIDSMIDGVGHKPVSSTIQKQLLDVKESLVKALDDVNPDYRTASEEFARLSGPVDALKQSKIGAAAAKKDTTLKSLSRMIFDAEEINPQVLLKTKAIIQKQNPQAWDDLLRVELEKRLGRAGRGSTPSGAAIPNDPAQLLSAIFGNAKQTKVLMASVNPEQRANLKWLRTVLQRAKEARPGGSPTQQLQEAAKRREVTNLAQIIFNPFKTLGGVGREAAQSSKNERIARVLFGTEFKKDIGKLRLMDLKSPATARAAAQLFNAPDTEETQ